MGGANARMFSLTECGNCHDRAPTVGLVLHDIITGGIQSRGWKIGRRAAYGVTYIGQPAKKPRSGARDAAELLFDAAGSIGNIWCSCLNSLDCDAGRHEPSRKGRERI